VINGGSNSLFLLNSKKKQTARYKKKTSKRTTDRCLLRFINPFKSPLLNPFLTNIFERLLLSPFTYIFQTTFPSSTAFTTTKQIAAMFPVIMVSINVLFFLLCVPLYFFAKKVSSRHSKSNFVVNAYQQKLRACARPVGFHPPPPGTLSSLGLAIKANLEAKAAKAQEERLKREGERRAEKEAFVRYLFLYLHRYPLTRLV